MKTVSLRPGYVVSIVKIPWVIFPCEVKPMEITTGIVYMFLSSAFFPVSPM